MGRFFRENLSLSFDATDSVAAGLFKHHCVAQIKQKHVYIYVCRFNGIYIYTYIIIYITHPNIDPIISKPNLFQCDRRWSSPVLASFSVLFSSLFSIHFPQHWNHTAPSDSSSCARASFLGHWIGRHHLQETMVQHFAIENHNNV